MAIKHKAMAYKVFLLQHRNLAPVGSIYYEWRWVLEAYPTDLGQVSHKDKGAAQTEGKVAAQEHKCDVVVLEVIECQ